MPSYTALRRTSECRWEAEIPFESMYNFSDNGGGIATVTCVSSQGKNAKFIILGEFDATQKITTWTMEWKIPWSGTQNGTGDQGDYEILTAVLEQENDSCAIKQCKESLSSTVSISGNAGYSNAEGYFNSSYFTTEKFCEIFETQRSYEGTFFRKNFLSTEYAVTIDGTCSDKGRCCMPDGTCREMDREQCNRLGGLFEPAESCCTPTIFGPDCTNPCAQPEKKGCCMPDGTCRDLTKEECLARGGDVKDQECSFVTCDPVGKCCLPSGDCIVTTPSDCTSRSGTYGGNGTNCNSGCAGDPTGACCLENGNCVETTNASCTAQGGNYQGDGSTCATANCGACAKCEEGGTAPTSVTLIVSGGTTNPGFDCDCPDVNGSFVLTPTDEQPCKYTYTNTCTPGFDIVYTAELFGFVAESQTKPGWNIRITYNGELITEGGFSAFVNCGGGGDEFRQSGKNGGLCEGSNLSMTLIV